MRDVVRALTSDMPPASSIAAACDTISTGSHGATLAVSASWMRHMSTSDVDEPKPLTVDPNSWMEVPGGSAVSMPLRRVHSSSRDWPKSAPGIRSATVFMMPSPMRSVMDSGTKSGGTRPSAGMPCVSSMCATTCFGSPRSPPWRSRSRLIASAAAVDLSPRVGPARGAAAASSSSPGSSSRRSVIGQ